MPFSQQKFKKLIESTKKYGLVNGKVVDLEEDPDAAAKTPAKKGTKAKATNTPALTPGRKRKAMKNGSEDESDVAEEPTPAPKKRAKSVARAAAKKNPKKELSSSEDDEDNIEEIEEIDPVTTSASAPAQVHGDDDEAPKQKIED